MQVRIGGQQHHSAYVVLANESGDICVGTRVIADERHQKKLADLVLNGHGRQDGLDLSGRIGLAFLGKE